MSIEEIKAIVEMSAMIIGGAWIMWRFSKQREMYPKVEFEVDCENIGTQKGKKVLQLTATIENKGIVRHKINGDSFIYTVRYIEDNDELENGFQANEQNYNELKFSKYIEIHGMHKFSWVPDYEKTFIDAGVSQKYRSVLAVPEKASFILLYSKFDYDEKASDEHSALRVFCIK